MYYLIYYIILYGIKYYMVSNIIWYQFFIVTQILYGITNNKFL